jgi:hypothetical protein
MTLGLVFAKAEALAVAVDVLKDVMILMALEPSFFPFKRDWFRSGWGREKRRVVG